MGVGITPLPLDIAYMVRELAYAFLKTRMYLRVGEEAGLSQELLRGIEGESEWETNRVQFVESRGDKEGVVVISSLSNSQRAGDLLEGVVEVNGATISLLYQLLGSELNDPCRMVVTYRTPDSPDDLDWFYHLAKRHGSRVINLADWKTQGEILNYIGDHCTRF